MAFKIPQIVWMMGYHWQSLGTMTPGQCLSVVIMVSSCLVDWILLKEKELEEEEMKLPMRCGFNTSSCSCNQVVMLRRLRLECSFPLMFCTLIIHQTVK